MSIGNFKTKSLIHSFQHLFPVYAGAIAHLPLILYRDIQPESDPIYTECRHRHLDFLTVYIVRQGRGIHVIDDVPYAIGQGDVYTMGMGSTHFYTQCENFIAEVLFFKPEIFDQITLRLLADVPGFHLLFVEEPLTRPQNRDGGDRWLRLNRKSLHLVLEDVAQIREEWLKDTPDGYLMARMLLVQMLIRLARLHADSQQNAPVSTMPEGHIAVLAAKRYMDEHYSESLRIEQVAASLFLSAGWFTRVFTAMVHLTPRDYLRNVRLEHAKQLLITSEQSITQIALDTGFGETTYFCRIFRSATGLAPTEFRRQPPETPAHED